VNHEIDEFFNITLIEGIYFIVCYSVAHSKALGFFKLYISGKSFFKSSH